MKKVLSLVLALVMVLGMSTMAFAADSYTWTGITGTVVVDVNGTGDLVLDVDGKDVVNIDVTATTIVLNKNGVAVAAAGTDVTGVITSITIGGNVYEVTAAAVNGAPAAGSVSLDLTVKAPTSLAGKQLTNNQSVSVKVNGSTYSIAANNTGISGVDASIFAGGGSGGSTDSIPSSVKVSAIASDWTRLVDFNAGDKIDLRDNKTHTEDISTKAPLLGGMFVWEASADTTINGTSYKKGVDIAATDVTWENTMVRSSHLKDVNVRRTNPVNANTSTIRDYGIDTTYLRIRTVKYFLKCGETDVSFDLDLTFKSKASGDLLPINFTLSNSKEWMYDGQDYVDMTDPIYVEADVSLRNVEMYIGENLYLTKSFGSGQRAYAHVDLELSAGDEKLFTQYSELSDVYTLYTVGVSSANVYAEFKDLGDTYFVYDENFKLLGTTADKKLPFSSKYYLTTKKVDMGTSSDPTETPTDNDSSTSVPTDTGAVGTGGGTVAAPSNYNPNTGC